MMLIFLRVRAGWNNYTYICMTGLRGETLVTIEAYAPPPDAVALKWKSYVPTNSNISTANVCACVLLGRERGERGTSDTPVNPSNIERADGIFFPFFFLLAFDVTDALLYSVRSGSSNRS